MENLNAKFWPNVRVRGPEDCWEWIGGKSSNGYGMVYFPNWSGPIGAHRVSYEVANGPIPRRKVVMHSCDNRGCVNPAHLGIGTHKENTADAIRKGRFIFPRPRDKDGKWL